MHCKLCHELPPEALSSDHPCALIQADAGLLVRAAALVDPKHRVVITGMGIASVFGNDVTKFYDR